MNFLLSKKINRDERDEFYQSKYNYFNQLVTYIVIISALSSLSYWVSDCQIFGHIAYETMLSRFSILLSLILYVCLVKTETNYKLLTVGSYVVAHSIMWCTIWSIYYLPDKTHANEGFIIIQCVFILLGICVPRGYSIIFHSIVIVNIIVSNQFNHYENFDLMITLGIPLLIGSELVMYYIEELYVDRYIDNKEIIFLTMHDQLTKVYNRNKLYEICKKDTNILDISNASLMIMDIDFFKQVNDTYGHDVGDKVLINLVNIINENISKDSMLLRWGGEEFVVILPDTQLEEAANIAEKIRQQIANDENTSVKITISIGVTKYNSDEDYHVAVKRADEHLYYAKEHGRNQVVIDK